MADFRDQGIDPAVKSTAAASTDLALVVAYHPNSATPAGTNNIGSVNVASGGTAIGTRPDGFMRVLLDPTTLLFDTFETIDSTNTWTLGGTSVPTGASGLMTVTANSTASATSYAVSKPTFIPGASAYLQFAALCTVQTGTVTGVNQFFGLAVIGTPTTALPITNGSIFEIDTTGALLGSVYSNSARTQTIALTKPTDGNTHRYAIYYKASRVYFEIDNVSVGSLPFPNPAVAALSCVIGQANSASIVGAPTLTASLIGVGDTGKNSHKIADGLYPWRTATVKPTTAPALTTDTSVVVALSPNSPVTLGTPTTFSLSSAATTNATNVKATAGTVFQIVASNVGAAAAFLKIFNLATAPTVGTSVPFLTVPIPASGVVSVPFGALGMRFSSGIALSITNLVADADATAVAAAQVKVVMSYL